MNIRDAYSAKAIALVQEEVASNKIAYLGEGLFPAKKKMGLDLKWIKANKGLPVSLAPSNFDAVSTLRSREGFKIQETEMAFFRESMLVKEADEQEMMRVQDSADPYAQDVLARIYDDANVLVAGAEVVPERMRMSLLAPSNGSPSISFSGIDGVTYAYNYDPDGSYAANNFLDLTSGQSTDQWDNAAADIVGDIQKAQQAVEDRTGSRPEIMIVSSKTMANIKKNTAIKNAIIASNVIATTIITEAKVKEYIKTELNVSIIVYTKKYKNESGVVNNFYPDGFATLIPTGALGSTFFGVTPEERTLMGSKEADVAIVKTGIAVAVSTTNDPVHTKTTVSEIVLPSYERMDETFVIKAYTPQ